MTQCYSRTCCTPWMTLKLKKAGRRTTSKVCRHPFDQRMATTKKMGNCTEQIELCGAGRLEQETWVSYRKWHLALTEERSELGNAHTHLLAPPGVGKSPAAGKGEENTEGQSLVENIRTNGLPVSRPGPCGRSEIWEFSGFSETVTLRL